MRRFALLFLCLGTTAQTAVAKPSQPIELARIGKWEMNYDTDSCHLYGKFGVGDQEVITSFTRYGPGDDLELTMYGKPLRADGQFLPVSIDFGPIADKQRREAMVGHSNKNPMAIFGNVRLDDWVAKNATSVPPASLTPEAEAKVTELTIKFPSGKHYTLALGSMRAPMAAMRTCLSGLYKSWGYDPEVVARLSRPATPTESPGKWLGSTDYPLVMAAGGQSGLVHFRLDLDELGAVMGCHVTGQAGDSVFASTTCKLLTKRAKMKPALDKDGKPVRGFFISSARWQIY